MLLQVLVCVCVCVRARVCVCVCVCVRVYVCVGTIGHVAHGKSTVVKAISGVQVISFPEFLEFTV